MFPNLGDWMWLSSEYRPTKGRALRTVLKGTLSVGLTSLHTSLHTILSCAGITGGKLQRIVDLPESEFDKVHSIDTRGMFLSLKAELKVMLAQSPFSSSPRASRGVIINVASRAGLEGVPTFGAYCTAKHGSVGLTKVAALEHAEDRIRINAIAPGLIKTPGHTSDPTHRDLDAKLAAAVPMKRWADPEECADAILFLASDASSFMTGAVLEVDGGMAAKSR